MKDSVIIARKFHLFYLGFILITVSMIVIAILTTLFVGQDWRFVIYFSELLLLLFLSYYFKRKLYELINLKYLIHIRESAAAPIELSSPLKTIDIEKRLLKKGYTQKFSNKRFALYIKIVRDDEVRRVFRHHILYAHVVIYNEHSPFYLKEVDEFINDIQYKSQTEDKKRIDRLLITQYKPVKTFNDEVKDRINEIIFIKTDRHVISTINVGIVEDPSLAVMLYSKTYKPSSYYPLHIRSIQEIL